MRTDTVIAGAFAALAACAGPGAEDTRGTDSAPVRDSPAAADADVVLLDANNYSYVGSLDAPSFPLAELTSVTLEWPNLLTDLRCGPLDPVADIDNTALIGFPYLTEQEVEQGLSDDTLLAVDSGVYLSYLPGDTTSVSLDQFTFFGTEANIKEEFYEGHGTWLVLLTTGTELAIGTRMLAFLEPTAGDAPTVAAVDDGCPVLDFDADLASLAPVPVLSSGPWNLDWSGLTRNGKGGAFEQTRVDSLMIARYDLSLDELQARFLDLEALALESWSYTLTGGGTADLAALSGPSDPFPGFTGDGTWILALRCSSCPNPAPLFLTVVGPG